MTGASETCCGPQLKEGGKLFIPGLQPAESVMGPSRWLGKKVSWKRKWLGGGDEVIYEGNHKEWCKNPK